MQQSPIIKLATVFFSFVLIIGGGMFFYNRYGQARQEEQKLENENAVLDNRIQILSTLPSNISQQVDTAYSSIPQSNAGLLAINSIKNLPGSENVIIDSVRVRSSLVQDLDQQQISEIEFSIEGETAAVFAFLENISRSLPLLKLTSVETSVTDEIFALSEVKYEAYSKALPKNLPALSEPLPVISDQDIDRLNELGEYSQAPLSLVEGEVPEGELGRNNPFSPVGVTSE